MNKEELTLIIKEVIRQELAEISSNDRFVFHRDLQIENARNIRLGRITGTKIGTSDTEKLGFYGTAPVAQQATISDPSGGLTVDSAARSAVETIIDRLQAIGIIK